MTWWEVEQIASTVADLEKALDDWALSTPQMRREQVAVDSLNSKIQQALEHADQPDKKVYLVQLANRVEELRQNLTERLRRDVPNRS